MISRPAVGLVVAMATAVLVCPRIGHRPIVGSHEAVFPIVARDIVQRGAWMHAELRGLPYRNKPPLFPWAIAVASWPTGRVTATTAQLPAALAAIAVATITFALGSRLHGRRVGVRAAAILLTSVFFFDQALATTPDLPMVAFGLLAALALWSLAEGGGRPAVLAFYGALALGVFTKGVPGLLPLAVALVWLGVGGERAALRRLAWAPGVLVFVVATAVWLVPYFANVGHHASTAAAARDWVDAVGIVDLSALGLQLARALLAFLPWTLVFPLALAAAWRAQHDRAVRFVLCWLAVQAGLVLVMQQQRGRYLLPLLPGAALLVAWWAERQTVTWRRWIAAAAAATALLLVAGEWIVDGMQQRAWDYQHVAATVEAAERPVAVAALADDHELLQVDFHLGRALPLLRSPGLVARHLVEGRGAVVMDTSRWKTASEWLPLDVRTVCARSAGADVVMVVHDRC